MSELAPLGDILVLGLTRDSCRVYKTVIVMFGILLRQSRCSLRGSRSDCCRSANSLRRLSILCLLKLLYDMLASAVTNI